jgi:hypothetical protein
MTKRLESIGHLACRLCIPTIAVRRIGERLNIEPALLLNDVQHFDGDDADTIAEYQFADHDGRERIAADPKAALNRRRLAETIARCDGTAPKPNQ